MNLFNFSLFVNTPSSNPANWSGMYTKSEMESSLEKIKEIYFCQTIVNILLNKN